MIRAIFFDFDGTISDAHKIVHDGMIWLFEQQGYNFDKKKLNELLGEKMEKIFEKMGFKANIPLMRKKFYDRLVAETDKYKLKLCVSPEPLRKLEKDHLLIVISNAESRFTKKCAKKLKVDSIFDYIYGAEGFTTKDVLMKKLFKKYKLKSREVIYVGDRFSDIQYAKKAGCWAVAIHNKYSWSSKKLILAEKPDFVIKDFAGLKKVVEKINNKNS